MNAVAPFLPPLIAEARAAERAVLAADDDAVHRLRGALRALRSVLRPLARSPVQRAGVNTLRGLFAATSALRDGEVQRVLLARLAARWPGLRPGVWEETDEGLLLARLAAGELEAALRALEVEAPSAPRAGLRRQADVLWGRVRRALRRALDDGGAARWHAARLALKRYRCWVKAFGSALPGRHRRRLQDLLPLQQALGEANDWSLLLAALESAPGWGEAWRLAAAQELLACAARRRRLARPWA